MHTWKINLFVWCSTAPLWPNVKVFTQQFPELPKVSVQKLCIHESVSGTSIPSHERILSMLRAATAYFLSCTEVCLRGVGSLAENAGHSWEQFFCHVAYVSDVRHFHSIQWALRLYHCLSFSSSHVKLKSAQARHINKNIFLHRLKLDNCLTPFTTLDAAIFFL